MSVQSFLESLREDLHSSANVKTVYGEPLQAQGKTIIPVARVAYGFGGGFGKKSGDLASGTHEQAPVEGGGGGVTVTPVGVIAVSSEHTRFVPVSCGAARLAGAFLGGILLGRLLQKRRSIKS